MAAWPTGDDLKNWIASTTISSDRLAMFDDIVAATIDVVWGDLDFSKMPDQAGPSPCPPGVRLAVLVLAARVDSRRQSTNGVIASGELFLRVNYDDPDYRRLIARYAVSAEP